MSKTRKYWDKLSVQFLAKGYETRSEFFRGSNSAYLAAWREGWLDDICSHMTAASKSRKHEMGYWTKERVLLTAKKFTKKSVFSIEEPSVYQKAIKEDWLFEVCAHMKATEHPSGYWTKKRVEGYALKCKSRVEFESKYGRAYAAAQRNGWLSDVCKHMQLMCSPPNYWTKERVQLVANDYGTRTDFYEGNKKAYAAAHRNQWLEDVCAHMCFLGNLLRRCIYVIFSKASNIAYVGLTFNFEKRMAFHFSGLNASTKELVISPDVKKLRLTDYIPSEEARRLELKFFIKYQKDGFEMLNRESSIGNLGGGYSKWNFDSVHLVAKQHKRRQDFRRNDATAYNVARTKGWLNEVCKHMRSDRNPHGFWSKSRVCSEALKYKTRAEFLKNAPGAVSKARKSGWMEDACQHMVPSVPFVKWTYEKVQKEALKYSTKKEFVKNAPGAASACYRNGWIKEMCSHMEPAIYARKWTFDRVKEQALKYETRSEFVSGSAAASAAKKNGWMNEVCQHMKSGRVDQRYWTFERVKKEASKFETKKDFRYNSGSAAAIAQKYGWLNEVCSHMSELRKKKGYWNIETLKIEALQFKTRTEFATKAKGAYSTAHRRGWLDIVCEHMAKTKP